MSVNLTPLRRAIRQKRQSLTASQLAAAAKAVCQKALTNPCIQTAQHIGVYLSQDNEVDLSLLIEQLWQQGKSTYLPIIHPFQNKHLWFGHYHDNSQFHHNRYHIAEPRCTAAEYLAPWECDVVLTPFVVCDQSGHRIGMGGGYYDRSFAFRQYRTEPILIGCGYDFQQVESLTPQPWDIALDQVILV